MAIDRDTLDSMLQLWAIFKINEFKEVSWPRISLTGRIADIEKLGIYSRGTTVAALDFEVPEHIDSVQKAVIELPLSMQQVIKAEYTGNGSQRRKAIKLKISYRAYVAVLCRARKQLMQTI